ncbi:MAG: lysylphosphatidylglycerol synthase domain-containing protein [Steroidobacteraceae bacterium]
MKYLAYVAGLLGLALLITLVIRADYHAILHTLQSGGWPLLWLVPYRALYFALYAAGWLVLLRPYDPAHRAGYGYLFWATSVREAVDRLLPVASVGGSGVGIRIVRWRGLAAPPVAATVIVEIVMTLAVLYLFTAVGLLMLVETGAAPREYHRLLLVFVLTLPVPVVSALLLKYGSAFQRLHGFLRPLVGASAMSGQAAALDRELRACMHRGRRLLLAGALQFAAFVSGSFEIWLALRLFGHPVGFGIALVLESMTQAVRHLAFVVPAGIGVQEAGLVVFGQALGIGGELALAVSMAKRMREVLCALPALASWQWLEGRRLQD